MNPVVNIETFKNIIYLDFEFTLSVSVYCRPDAQRVRTDLRIV